MAPEQFRGRADAPADAWALGITLYEAIEGTLPFRGDNVAMMAAIVFGRPAPSRNAGPLRDIIDALLAKDPDKRPKCDEIVDFLDKAVQQASGAGKDSSAAKKASSLVKQGRGFREKKQYAEAEAAFLEAIRLDPASAKAYNELGHVFRYTGRSAEAKDAYREANRLAPGNHFIYLQNMKGLGGDS
jgi:serine/threonine protein kinase